MRCGFTGTEEDVLRLNEQDKYRYKAMKKRVVSFGEDNEPIIFKDHLKGEM